LVANNLKGIVTSVSVGNADPWEYGDFSSLKPSSSISSADIAIWSTLKFFDLSLTQSLSLDLIKKYLQDPVNFRVSDTTIGSSGNDSINTYVGNNNVYLKGGFDNVIASGGNDSFFLSYLYKKNISFEYGVWVTKPSDVVNSISLDFGNGKTYEIKFNSTKPYIASSGYWELNTIELDLPGDLKLDTLIFTMLSGGWARVGDLIINGSAVDAAIGTHTKVESWSAPNFVVRGDKYTFNLESLIKKDLGKKTLIDGGSGVDKIYFENSTTVSDFKITILPNKINFSDVAGKYPPVESTNVERLIFSDKSIAIDINGNAGTTAKLLGAVFGKDSLTNKQYVGIGLSLLDAGMSTTTLASLAVDAANLKTNDQIVSTLWKNVFGTTASNSDKAPYVKLIDDGMSPGTLSWLAADTTFNKVNINLVGLAQTGIEYIPVS
jgi:hypothetical protein